MQQSDLSQSILTHIRQNVSSFRELNLSNIHVERMAGRTNETYKVSVKDSDLPPVIYRKFGESEQSNFFIIFRPFPGQGDIKDNLRARVGPGAGPEDSLLHRGHDQDRGVHRVKGFKEQGDPKPIGHRERGIHIEKIPRYGGALENLKEISVQISVHGPGLVTAQDLSTQNEPTHLHLALTTAPPNPFNLDQPLITILHPVSHRPSLIPAPGLLTQRSPG